MIPFHETVYNAIYVYPRGELKTQLIALLPGYWEGDLIKGASNQSAVSVRDADGTELLSVALITINANAHQLVNRYQRAGAEKACPPSSPKTPTTPGSTHKSKEFLRVYPAQKLLANPVEKKGTKHPLGI